MGTFNFSICICSEYHPLTIFNCRFLYYITNPIVELLEKHLKIKRVFGILITLVLLFGIIGLGIFYLLPILINQLTSLINSTQGLYWEVQSLVRKLSTNPLFQNVNIQSTIQQLNLSYMDILQNLLNSVTNSLGSVVNTIVNTVFILIMTPVFLVYFLVDGKSYCRCWSGPFYAMTNSTFQAS